MKYAFQTSLKALTSYEKAREWFPSHAQANCNIGVLLYQSGRLEEAEAQLRHTVQVRQGFYLYGTCTLSFAVPPPPLLLT